MDNKYFSKWVWSDKSMKQLSMGCLEELNPRSSGLAVAQEDGDLTGASNVYCLVAGRSSKLHVHFIEPTAHVQ